MSMPTLHAPAVAAVPVRVLQADRALCERVRGEYNEMPGLRLTLAQASRLFSMEMTHCSQVLETLVTQGVLWTNGREFLAKNVGRPSA